MAVNPPAVAVPAPPASTIGEGWVGWFGLLTTLGILLLTGAGLAFALVQFLPPAPIAGASAGTERLPDVQVFGLVLSLSRDGRLFVVVSLAGAMGATIYALRSFVWYAGNRTLKRSWLPMYYAMPVLGALVGLLFYFVLRGGLLSPTATAAETSPYGFAAITALVGLFLAQALEKLKGVFEALFTPAPQGEDHTAAAADQVQVSGFAPDRGGIGTRVTIVGQGLSKIALVRFGGVPTSPTQVRSGSVVVLVPAGAVTGPITLEGPNLQVTCPGQFQVV